ncbi:hypothetical protein [Ammoniphilus resinae]|uniref:CENP-V/GFA domain-containing protein n=1 Tax=Ammoniphilus resinae TaxID=861532 RepID=A0ABS4GSV5_9BACL|nr:hypothetical protein [Ammoniphilus resinae]MBP1933365.1 hypothetical protein [Ammoniphilus resinae]
MFILKCECGAESKLTKGLQNVLKPSSVTIKIEGDIEVYIDNDSELSHILCTKCGTELSTMGGNGINE